MSGDTVYYTATEYEWKCLLNGCNTYYLSGAWKQKSLVRGDVTGEEMRDILACISKSPVSRTGSHRYVSIPKKYYDVVAEAMFLYATSLPASDRDLALTVTDKLQKQFTSGRRPLFFHGQPR